MKTFQEQLDVAIGDVRRMYAEQGNKITAREAHDAWRWVLITCAWKQGNGGMENRQHPLLCSFDSLPVESQDHALKLIEPDATVISDADALETVESLGTIGAKKKGRNGKPGDRDLEKRDPITASK